VTSRILIIDDEDSMRNMMEIMLAKEGYQVETTNSPKSGISLLREKNYDLVIADLQMPEMTGIEVLKEVKSFKRDQHFIVMTAYGTVETAIEAMKQGAADYITKPFQVDELKLLVDNTINRKKLIEENSSLKRQLQQGSSFDNFIGNSEAVVQLKAFARKIAATDSTVLIRGESGTGKDLIARAIHNQSPRSNGPFITINCGALPETLLESELFGYKKGAFTGAIKDKDGLFKVADGGTFFLDEVGTTSLSIQVKLLRVLEDRRITPVGDTKPLDVDVRLIAATNSDLEDDVKNNRFRADLFYRLNVIPIHIPALRERIEDIPLLVSAFVERFCRKSKISMKQVSADVLRILSQYHWPGNVRELENIIERAVLLNKGDGLELADFPEKLLTTAPNVATTTSASPATPTLESIEKAYIHFVMTQAGGKKSEAAKVLGIDPSTLYRKIERYQLTEFLSKEK
jgi:DNA-binding NtrC family response regulator